MFFFTKTPSFIRRFYSQYLWNVNTLNKEIYLTFDDGPTADVSTWVLDQLKKNDAKATFFCLGKQIVTQPAIFQRMRDEGHSIGNHGDQHLNGWKTSKTNYLLDYERGQKLSNSKLYRPPYGKIKKGQAQSILADGNQIVLWDIMPGDWKQNISSEKVLKNILGNIENGSIIVLHDNEKAHKHLKYVLPILLKKLKLFGFQLKGL